MKKAPLIYTLGMLRFPRVPEIERFVDKFMESVRNEYPIDDAVIAQAFSANINTDGITINPQETKQWQYASIDRTWGFVLNDQALCLHTSKYHDFEDFIQRFRIGIMSLGKIPSMDIKWMTSVGIRHVNMVIAPDGANLNDYLQPWVLPIHPSGLALKAIEGIYIARYKTEYGELRLQSLHNPSFTLPPELNSAFIMKNGWLKANPDSSCDFALIDIDHGSTWSQPLPFDTEKAIDVLGNLKKSSRAVFNSIGTNTAINAWRGQ